MYAIATSDAIGTGRKAEITATTTIPITLTGRTRDCCGISSITTAPSAAARIINGKATRNTVQKLFTYERTVSAIASPHVSLGATLIARLSSAIGCRPESRPDIAGTNRKIRNSTLASFKIASDSGNNVNVIASTTRFRAGEANIAASTDSLLIPDA